MAKLYVPLGFVLAAMISADVDNCPDGVCKAVSALSMLQSKAVAAAVQPHSSLVAAAVDRPAKSSLVAAARLAPSQTAGCPNLAMFMDGTWNWLGQKCQWLTDLDCETNIAKMYKLSAEIDDSIQKTMYENGVGTGTVENDDGMTGTGTRAHAENVYKWLTENYNGCNKLFMFGFSRGTLEARIVQGMIHRVGIAKAGFHAEAVKANFDGGDADAATFKASEKAWDTTAEIEFVGFFDAVLRTLYDVSTNAQTSTNLHDDIAGFHMQMTSSVKKLAHAIAISEWRETHHVGALVTNTATLAEQVWFAGIHKDVGGGLPATGASRIAAGWILDKAVDAGLVLPDNWQERDTMAVDYLDDVSSEKSFDALAPSFYRDLKIHTIRNPAECRTAAGFSGKIKYHQSIQDRRTANKGWVPLPECCPTIKSEVEEFGIEYVTNSHYNARKPAVKSSPHWLKISIGKLKNAPPMEYVSYPDYYLKVFNWHSKADVSLPEGAGAGQGCCAILQKSTDTWPTYTNTGSWWWPVYKYDLDFTGTTFIIPYEASVADMIVVEVHENDWSDDDYVGRTKVDYLTLSSTQRTFDIGGGATIEITVETINNDEDAAPLLGGDLATCQWLDLQTGLSRNDMCTSDSIYIGMGLGNAKTCDGYIEDITTGALIDVHGHH